MLAVKCWHADFLLRLLSLFRLILCKNNTPLDINAIFKIDSNARFYVEFLRKILVYLCFGQLWCHIKNFLTG